MSGIHDPYSSQHSVGHVSLQWQKDKPMNTSVVLITGALTDIGRATTLAFAKDGASVVVSGRHKDAGHLLDHLVRAPD
jgi:hypothetical protein